MPRQRSINRNDLISNALMVFWRKGYAATSVDDLVKATGVGRGALYTDFNGKKALFLACLETYCATGVDPAFARVEAADSGFKEISKFIDTQLDRFVGLDVPMPGCLIANTLAEACVEDAQIRSAVHAHYERLTRGFVHALSNEARRRDLNLSRAQITALAEFATLSIQGLWSYGRIARNSDTMRQQAKILVSALEQSLSA
jgi:TetR/AcrR family transcriptional repressor of nem operon